MRRASAVLDHRRVCLVLRGLQGDLGYDYYDDQCEDWVKLVDKIVGESSQS